jgi:hypothetical protein
VTDLEYITAICIKIEKKYKDYRFYSKIYYSFQIKNIILIKKIGLLVVVVAQLV